MSTADNALRKVRSYEGVRPQCPGMYHARIVMSVHVNLNLEPMATTFRHPTGRGLARKRMQITICKWQELPNNPVTQQCRCLNSPKPSIMLGIVHRTCLVQVSLQFRAARQAGFLPLYPVSTPQGGRVSHVATCSPLPVMDTLLLAINTDGC